MKKRIIETEIWEPNPERKGWLRFIKTRKMGEVFDELLEILKENEMLPGEYFMMANGFDEDVDMPKDISIATVTKWGSNEGIYIDVYIETDRERIRFATGKDLGETEEDYNRMLSIAGFIYKSFAGFGRAVSDKKDLSKFVVCINDFYIRDSQYFCPEIESDAEFVAVDYNNDDYWRGCNGRPVFVDIIEAASEDEALNSAAEKHGYDKQILLAIKVQE